MKKLILWVSLVTVMLGITGHSIFAKETIKIGLLQKHLRESVFVFQRDVILQQAEKDGNEVITLSSDTQEMTEIRNVEDLITRGIDVLIFSPVAKGTTVVEKCEEEGIPVVALDMLPYDVNLALYVTGFSFRVGQLQAEYVAKEIGYKGNVIILQGGPGHNVAMEITAGYYDVFNKYPDIKVLVDKTHNLWDERLAMQTVEDAITRYGNKINAVLANNSAMAMGAVAALKAAGLEKKVITTGADANLAACKGIIAGDHDMDVDKRPIEMAIQSYRPAAKIAKGEPVEADMVIKNGTKWVPTKYVEPEAITIENVREMTYRWPELEELLKE